MSSGWNTIESDAVMEKLQVKNVQFEELYSFDQETLSSIAPLYGVIFLFKYGQSSHGSELKDGVYDFDNQDSIFFAKQTIQNACATQAVLNVLLNRNDIDLGPELTNFKEFVGSFDPDLKGETISNSDLIRSIHNSFSSPNSFIDESQQDQPQDDDDDGLYHFVGYVRSSNGHLLELDGLQPAPIDHGLCETDDEFISKLPTVLSKRISHFKDGELRFSLLGIVQDRRKTLKEIGDEEGLEREILKRQLWKRENELRKQDFAGLVYNVLTSISKGKSDDEWNEILNKARTKGVSRILAKQLRR
ncbi:hypothetical protein BN7_1637 [Wickerhamomyces ciferrii]|uniref:Ubiquitin carboxyl-terminal hydrolase n=1 Tax=Wickerhamomyces ciferrii (strain ATCC 14091 / BCRC 22168 / CBS 111 / JCM 3599 / NBRC 0793 / NRRL Y-1031 F-60-10) TaxID=1206466 RepID=K0KAR9_WICCF|nr:uncharacterized protein BN7_1637 [Wickerhamomyces ciferrii]CCH42095.1 hypothetical protein BN7_1637 [Wickerhamomyces ciferrii]